MNIRAILVTAFAALLVSCGPEKDILHQWAGAYVAYDNDGPMDRGCVVSAGPEGRTLVEWRYTADGGVERTTHTLDHFELVDQYSSNYGTFRPTWIYRYAPAAGDYPCLLFYEYFDGEIAPHLQAASNKPVLPLQASDGVPRILRLENGDVPDRLSELRKLDGRHFWIEGTVRTAERREQRGHAFTASTDLFGEGFIDQIELEKRQIGAWTIYPILRSPVMSPKMQDHIAPPAAGDAISELLRLVEVREKAGTDERAVVLSFRYDPS